MHRSLVYIGIQQSPVGVLRYHRKGKKPVVEFHVFKVEYRIGPIVPQGIEQREKGILVAEALELNPGIGHHSAIEVVRGFRGGGYNPFVYFSCKGEFAIER